MKNYCLGPIGQAFLNENVLCMGIALVSIGILPLSASFNLPYQNLFFKAAAS